MNLQHLIGQTAVLDKEGLVYTHPEWTLIKADMESGIDTLLVGVLITANKNEFQVFFPPRVTVRFKTNLLREIKI